MVISNTLFLTLCFFFSSLDLNRSNNQIKPKGPQFIDETSQSLSHSFSIDFYNSSGAVFKCKAKGDPKPSITWIRSDEMININEAAESVNEISGLRYFREDGSMILIPFSEDNYRKDVHSTTYRCIASNQFGSIMSANIEVNAGK